MVSDDDVSNYNKIKNDLDKLRLLVEQSELWIFKKKEKENADDAPNETKFVDDRNKNLNQIKSLAKNASLQNEKLSGDQYVLQELENGPEIEMSAILKYKELYRILFNMIKLCVNETKSADGTITKKPRRNDQRLLRNMGVHNIVLELTKISYEKSEDIRMRIIMKTAHEFLQNFCFGNTHNQSLLYEKLDLTHYPSNEWEATTATYIFKVKSYYYVLY